MDDGPPRRHPQRVTPRQYYGSNNWFLEGYSVMAYLAGVTERVRIGSSVVVLPYRNPIVQARAVQTIDVLSGGRISLGVGAGHVRAESEALGVPYDERAAMTEEYIQVMRAVWAGDAASFHGRYFDFDEALTLGRTVQRPPPIYYGGMAKAAIRRAVRLCDGWLASPAPMEPEQFKAGVDFAREEARRIGRCRARSTSSTSTRDAWRSPTSASGPSGRRSAWAPRTTSLATTPSDELADRLRRYERGRCGRDRGRLLLGRCRDEPAPGAHLRPEGDAPASLAGRSPPSGTTQRRGEKLASARIGVERGRPTVGSLAVPVEVDEEDVAPQALLRRAATRSCSG